MDGRDAASQIVHLDVNKTGLFHHPLKLIPIRKLQD